MIPPQRNADFAAGMEKVLDVYRRAYDADFPVVCMDETPRQLIGETRTPVPPAPGREAREDYEYRRCGTCTVFMATEPLAGWRLTKVTERRTKKDWVRFLHDIAGRYPAARPAPCGEAVRPDGSGAGPVLVSVHFYSVGLRKSVCHCMKMAQAAP